MLRRLLSRKIYHPIIIGNRCINSDNSAIISLMGHMFKIGKSHGKGDLYAIQNGTSRYWDLGNNKSQYVCVGGMGPLHLKDKIEISKLIDFSNMTMNKLGIEILDCPKLLKMQIAKSFPRLEYLKDAELRIIKLSHDKYTDQMQGKLDCVIVANHICKQLTDEGEFGFYSGTALEHRDATNGIFFHNDPYMKLHNNYIHATVDSNDGYMSISNLSANDVGVIYTDCKFNLIQFSQWLENNDM